MNDMDGHREEDDTFWAPGTVRLEHVSGPTTELILHPVPTSDPDDPLNWSTARKTLNFTLVCFYVLWTFVQLDIGFTAWGPMFDQLGFTIDEMNNGAALNYGGLAIGCIFFVPFVHKYGRRPLYLFSSALQLASVVWFAKTQTVGDLMGSNLISGLGGAISETVVQITIADIFFVHQHGTMNGWYLMFTSVGAFLGPVASGYVVESQGWRWMWWWCVIFMALNLVLVMFLFEESKYIPVVHGRRNSRPTEIPGTDGSKSAPQHGKVQETAKGSRDFGEASLDTIQSIVDPTMTRKTYSQRLALITASEGSVTHHIYQPVIVLCTFPAVAYAALTYGTVLSSFAIMTSVQATYLLEPPYNFGAVGVGLMNIAPFVGAVIGFFVGGYLSDKSIVWLSKRNRGIYEPEMRLWLALIATVLLPAGILMFGLGLVRGVHWAVLAVGFGLFGFAFVLTGDIALAYTTDCYSDIIGDALVGIVFTRNAFSVIVLFALTPWINGMGVQNVHVLTAAVCFAVLLLPVALLMWGKRARIATAKKYEHMALRQPAHRTTDEHS
ncbi:major facilitator superfamily domain-containing protein [Lophiotrema nucula]|uniref:Major facilitator superfamily domain-containing protein n=1 Tax=Lophiotrema nucula TaxID=690887 RepID=A0A6A5YH62_9PLEO|nr:major facilitator superfamily domain-containing protein [Lophiotrema nucula]